MLLVIQQWEPDGHGANSRQTQADPGNNIMLGLPTAGRKPKARCRYVCGKAEMCSQADTPPLSPGDCGWLSFPPRPKRPELTPGPSNMRPIWPWVTWVFIRKHSGIYACMFYTPSLCILDLCMLGIALAREGSQNTFRASASQMWLLECVRAPQSP